ncbi:STAS/SEC14 domain-containing protein [Haliea sp. AH-315-K21]|uniref:STAS/SEC14 domain-containing protein n=1 Tax=SAR86 cluster bacterium TaxID=2030880 RepID=A0A2A5CIZ9_9GAMM|nr:STAS/SEC14 domain-containing protein [Haliea sp. AH-315-K21]MBN4075241.1 STAS/SEC14 domain-containing protein [Gammaproteobacteria bacterium AH-315-E17]PCJ43762.1 MAG: hypothetical protein COA71_02525 [SAR86 cluster bacterium]
MLTVNKIDNQRLDIELSGKLDTEDMKTALDQFIELANTIYQGKMLYTIVDFHLPSLGAIIHEFSRLPAMLRIINNFDRAAILTDKVWLQKAAEIEGKLIPGLKIKAFNLNQKTEAEAWLNSDE